MKSERPARAAREPFGVAARFMGEMRPFRTSLVLILAALVVPAGPGLAQPAIPEALEPWRDWVLFGQEYRACPVLNGRDVNQEASHVCAWPGELAIDVETDGATFEQSFTLYRDEWVPLPGDARYWPGDVTVDGEPRAAVLRGGRPTVRVEAGEHAIAGSLGWETRPAQLPVPPETGLVALTLDGTAVPIPELERGVLWLGLRPDLVVEEDRLSVEVYRLLTDSIPLRVETRIQLDVAGQSRELELTGALLPDFVGESLSSELPAELDPDGTLRIQVRPGRWVATLVAHHPDIVAGITRPDAAAPWPADEIWSFRSNPLLRVAVLEGAPAIDSARAGVPAGWRSLPSYAVAPGTTLDLVERSRNDAEDDNELALTRFLWLDFDGGGFTAQDNVAGQLRSEWRLDMAPPFTLTSARIGNENLLVTEGEEPGTQGVELRTPALDLTATARLPSLASLPVTGYTDRFNSASTILYLPPAHRLIAAPGADAALGAWVERWLLLDIFLALIIGVASWRLLGALGGGIALVTMVLIWHEPSAPQYAWLNLLLITALLRVVPEGRFRAWCGRYRYLSLAILALLLIPFVYSELRVVVFPQLEEPAVERNLADASSSAFNLGASIANLRGLNTSAGARTLALVDARRFEDRSGEVLGFAAAPEPQGQPGQQGQQGRLAQEAAAERERVIVTGTRLRDDFTSPNAAAVVSAEEMQRLGVVSVADMINQLPANVPTEDALNMLPTALVGRLETVTGGASATYGADAMAGVVNVILDTPGSRYQPGALIQTGPGLPDWAWSRYALSFAGPIDRDETFTVVIFGPWLVGLWRVAGVALALALALMLLKPDLKLPQLRPGRAAAGAAALIVGLGALALPRAGDAQTADTFPSPQLLEELRLRLTRPAPCHPACAELTEASVDVGETTLTMSLEIAVQDSLAVPLPGDLQGWRPESVTVDGETLRMLFRDPAGQAWIRLPEGVRDLRLEGPIPVADSLRLPFPLPPRRIAVAAPGWDIAGVAEGRLPAGTLELIRQRQAEDDDAAIQATAFPPYVQVTRQVQFGIDWTVLTSVRRIAPREGAFTLGIDLLPGEAVVTENIDVEAGVATVAFAAGQNAVNWQSRLPTADMLSLVARDEVPWSEAWLLNVGYEWHAEHEGLPTTFSRPGPGGIITEYLPRPGETLDVALTRPEPVSGDTIAIDDVRYVTSIGDRTSRSTLDFVYRSTRAIEHPILLPEASELESVTIDGTAVPLELDGSTLSLPVTPGEHRIGIVWRNVGGIGVDAAVAPIDLGAGTSNITTRLALPDDRWTLLTYGPTLGPAVLYWSELAVFVLAALILGRVRLSPLKTHEWLLLGLGLSTFSWPVLVFFAVWAFIMSLRGRTAVEGGRWRFNIAQIVLALLTLGMLAALIGSIANGLLGTPNMHVVSPVPGGGPLSWFEDRSDGTTPAAGAISVSLWFYKAAMLAWALWLSFAVLRWLRFAWTAFSFEGVWRGKVAAAKSG